MILSESILKDGDSVFGDAYKSVKAFYQDTPHPKCYLEGEIWGNKFRLLEQTVGTTVAGVVVTVVGALLTAMFVYFTLKDCGGDHFFQGLSGSTTVVMGLLFVGGAAMIVKNQRDVYLVKKSKVGKTEAESIQSDISQFLEKQKKIWEGMENKTKNAIAQDNNKN